MYKYLKEHQTKKQQLISYCVLIIWACIVSTWLYQMDTNTTEKVGILHRLIFVLQSPHNQLYFGIPILSVSWLLIFKTPTHQELYLISRQKKFPIFLLFNVLKMLKIFCLGTFLGTIAYSLLPIHLSPIIWDVQNLFLAFYLFILHCFGLIVYLGILALLSVLFNKVSSLIFWGVLLYADYFTFNTCSWSFFISRGLTFPSTEYGMNLLIYLSLYSCYIYVLFFLSDSFLQKRKNI